MLSVNMLNLVLIIWIVNCFLSTSGDKTVKILPPTNLNPLKDDEIINAFNNNETNVNNLLITMDNNNNYTEMLKKFPNNSHVIFNQSDDYTNPYYDEFKDEIKVEVNKLLDLIPAFDPGSGGVSSQCKKHSEIFKKELKRMSIWALKMYDATAKIPSGLLSGNVNQFGDFDECLSVDGGGNIKGKYCLTSFQLDVDQIRPDLKHLHQLFHSHYAFRSNMTDPGHRVPRFSSVQWGVCIPSICTAQDVETSLRVTLQKYIANTGFKVTVKVDPEMCQVQRTQTFPVDAVIVGLLFIGFIILSIVAALLDHYQYNVNEIVLSFSLKRNFHNLISLKRNDDDIASLHGVRAINAMMLIVAHKSMALFFNPYVNRTAMSECLGRPWTVIGRAASLYTDPFIMLSGLLTTHSFVKQLNRSGKINIKKEYSSRLLRLVPTLGALILFCMYIMPYIGSGPQWNLVVTHHSDICKKTWWRNLLFIHNYFGFENMCLTHTHHIGIDTQLFALSPLMILGLYKWPKIGGIGLLVVATLSTVLRFYVTYSKQLSNYVFFGTSIRQLFDTANYSYILPSHRLTVYIIGIFVGYLLQTWPKKYQLSKQTIVIGWIVTSLAALAAFLGPSGMGSINYVYNPVHAAAYNAFAPIGWCAIFAWIVILSHTNNTQAFISRLFAWRGFIIFTKLSYAIYLTQFPVFFYNVGETRSAEYYEFFRMQLNLKEVLWIILTSVILTLLFDFPFQNIKNHLIKKSNKLKKDN